MPYQGFLGLRVNPLRQQGELKRRDIPFEVKRVVCGG